MFCLNRNHCYVYIVPTSNSCINELLVAQIIQITNSRIGLVLANNCLFARYSYFVFESFSVEYMSLFNECLACLDAF